MNANGLRTPAGSALAMIALLGVSGFAPAAAATLTRPVVKHEQAISLDADDLVDGIDATFRVPVARPGDYRISFEIVSASYPRSTVAMPGEVIEPGVHSKMPVYSRVLHATTPSEFDVDVKFLTRSADALSGKGALKYLVRLQREGQPPAKPKVWLVPFGLPADTRFATRFLHDPEVEKDGLVDRDGNGAPDHIEATIEMPFQIAGTFEILVRLASRVHPQDLRIEGEAVLPAKFLEVAAPGDVDLHVRIPVRDVAALARHWPFAYELEVWRRGGPERKRLGESEIWAVGTGLKLGAPADSLKK